jgi:hypothetical protein
MPAQVTNLHQKRENNQLEETNIRVRPLTNSKSFCDFLRILREKKIISRRTRRNTQKKTNKELIY